MPSTGQLTLLAVSIAFFLVGGIVSFLRLRADTTALKRSASLCFHGGVISAIAVLVWHDITRHSWFPLEDNFDTFIWLALLLSFFVMYVQITRPVGVLDWFVMPIVILAEVAAMILGRADFHRYTSDAWYWVHRVSAFGGGVAFALAAATGAMYLLSSRRLRSKSRSSGPSFGSLERLEHLTRVAVTFGFALLTIGLITGLMRMIHEGSQSRVRFSDPKVFLTFPAWLVYALVLHAPINPSFRGRRTAILSIFGFVLMIAVFIAVLLKSGGPS